MYINIGFIVIKKLEFLLIVYSYFDESKGDGVLKLFKIIWYRYSGLLWNFI